jgi:hypothetical protein
MVSNELPLPSIGYIRIQEFPSCHKSLSIKYHASSVIHNHKRVASWVLFLDIQLRTPLLRLSSIMLLLGFKLCLAIPGNSSNGPTNCSRDTIRHARTQVAELTLGFLGLAAGVLFPALLLETLVWC